MSIPKIGIKEEVKGEFNCEVLYEILNSSIRFSVGDSLDFSNEYFQNLYDEECIELVLSVDCFNAYKEEKVCLRDERYLDYPTKDVGGKFTVSVYFVASKDFEIDTNNEFFDEFYKEKFYIQKGQIVSKIITRYINIQTTSSRTSAKLLELVKDTSQNHPFDIRLAQQTPLVSVKSEDLFFMYNKLRNSTKFKGVKDLVDAVVLGPIHIELIRILVEGRIDDENYDWAESISIALGYSSLEELRKEVEQEEEQSSEETFQMAYNKYASKLFSDNHLLDLLQHLNNL